MMNQITPSQLASWYHSQIPRIPHGNQHPKKRYLTDTQVLELFDGTVSIQEKVDGKLSWDVGFQDEHKLDVTLVEDMTGKHTVHNHVMHYNELPVDKRIILDYVRFDCGRHKVLPHSGCNLGYAVLFMESPTIEQIYQILGAISQSPSHYGSPTIEGLVIKNYAERLFGKWINDEFEDKLEIVG